MSTLHPTMSRAEPPTKPDCSKVIEAADKAIGALENEVAICRQGLLIYSEQNKALVEDNAAKSRALEAWYRNPWIVGGLGLLGGVVTGVIISR